MTSGAGPSGPQAGRALAAALRDNPLWQRAEQLAELGIWEWDPATDELGWSDNMFRLMGMEPGEYAPTVELLFARMHPGDVERVQEALHGPRGAGETAVIEYRVVRADDDIRHLQGTRVGEADASGRLIGFVRDVTEQRLTELEVALHGSVARALAAWDSFADGAELLLSSLASVLSAPAACLWLPEGGVLAPRVLWCEENVPRRAFERVLEEMERSREQGLAGQAAERRCPVTPATAGGDDAFGGRMAAALDGISAAAALPALAGERVLAVVVLYAGEPLEAGERLRRAFADVGAEIGAFLARRPAMVRLSLTARELEVLKLAAAGLDGPEIASALLLSTATVKTHLANAYAKIGVSNRVAAVAYALREGLIE